MPTMLMTRRDGPVIRGVQGPEEAVGVFELGNASVRKTPLGAGALSLEVLVTKWRSVLALMFGAALSCGSPTEPSFLPTDLEITNVTFTGPPAPPVSVTTSRDTVRITGGIEMNEPCYDFTATAAVRRDTVVVDLVATERAGHCQHFIAGFAYAITITAIDSGVSALRLAHERRHPNNVRIREAVLEQALQVL